ncbi:MAG: aminodeoxychorismate synthase component I, partial [Bacteroidota bacterium]|nr:aminodeoxychorismate synthase component I [Bacteroidota bacterium]
MRIEKSLEIPQDLPLLQQLVCWANQEPVSCLLLSNNQVDAYGAYDYVFAAGAHESLQVSTGTAFEALKAFRKRTQDFLLGYFSYDLKNELEDVKSENLDGLDF